MSCSVQKLLPGLLVLAVIALPKPNRARQHEFAIHASLQLESAYIVVDAAEMFAEQNSGIYPSNISGFQSWFPLGNLLLNPYTLARTEPADGSAAVPGQLGYVVVSQGGYNVGFALNAFGRNAELLSISRYPGASPIQNPARPEHE